ncbi:MAG: diguanylate cyclase domain-containing protein, partial [Steroidobacteraceae bacterium]
DTLARLGGDEFVVIAEDISLAAGPDLVAERLLAALKEPFKLEGAKDTPFTVTASVGIAVGDRVSPADLLRDADIAMYRAKWPRSVIKHPRPGFTGARIRPTGQGKCGFLTLASRPQEDHPYGEA